MPRMKATDKGVKLLARLMRAEAEGDGKLGMLMVGNVGVNRVVSDCLDFTQLGTIKDMVYQSPGGFESTQYGYFYQRARDIDIKLARKAIKGGRYHPASYALWFFAPTGDCPAQWFDQKLIGRFKSHCFFAPLSSVCPQVY